MIVTDSQLEGVAAEAIAKVGKSLPVFVNGPSKRGHANISELLSDPNRPYCDLVEVSGGEGEREGGKTWGREGKQYFKQFHIRCFNNGRGDLGRKGRLGEGKGKEGRSWEGKGREVLGR